MDLEMERLDDLEAPLSNEFWEGVGIGVTIGAGIVAVIALT
jgi:hypothetical protein